MPSPQLPPSYSRKKTTRGCERYMELDPALREFLEGMDQEDVDTAKQILKTYKSASIVSRFMKWLIITVFVIFMSAAGLWEKLAKLFFGGTSP